MHKKNAIFNEVGVLPNFEKILRFSRVFFWVQKSSCKKREKPIFFSDARVALLRPEKKASENARQQWPTGS